MINQVKNLIVVGASAGGIKAVTTLIEGIPESIDAAIMVVVHLSKNSNAANIAAIFQRKTALKCTVASNKMKIERGKIYIAPPGHQLLVSGESIILNQGATENRYNPSIDVLFRSAAVHCKNQTVGIILTGMLEDGTSGMYAIKSCGGICVVQDPSEAEYGDMPRNVIKKIEVDHVGSLMEIPQIIQDIVNNPLPTEVAVPNELLVEAGVTEKLIGSIDELKEIGDRSDFICPDCGGGLWEIKNDPTHRYRCHTGHVYSEKLLRELQNLKVEESVWVSIRMLNEKRNMLELLMKRHNSSGHGKVSPYRKRIDEINEHIQRLKNLLMNLTNNPIDETEGPLD